MAAAAGRVPFNPDKIKDCMNAQGPNSYKIKMQCLVGTGPPTSLDVKPQTLNLEAAGQNAEKKDDDKPLSDQGKPVKQPGVALNLEDADQTQQIISDNQAAVG